MTFSEALKALRKGSQAVYGELVDARIDAYIDTLTHAERIELREAAACCGITKLPCNLFYDYEQQVWIVDENGKLSP